MSAPAAPPPWYSGGLEFACVRCGNCCAGAPGYVWVSSDDCLRIAQYLQIPTQTFTENHVRRVGLRLSLREKPGGDCEFLRRGSDDSATTCVIHPVRPTQCRTWPFWKSNLKSAKTWAAAALGCPGIGHSPLHTPAVIETALRANGDLPL